MCALMQAKGAQHMSRALRYLVNQRLAWSWNMWLCTHKAQAEIIQAKGTIIAHMRNRNLSKAFVTWTGVAEQRHSCMHSLRFGLSNTNE